MSIVKKLLKARWSSSLIFLILLFLITGLANASFLSYSNIIACFNTATMYTLLAIGIAFVIMTGEIDVSIGAVLGLAASVTGMIAQEGGSIGKMLPKAGPLKTSAAPWLSMAICRFSQGFPCIT